MSVLERSWSSFSRGLAAKYLKSHGHPSPTSKHLLVDVLEGLGSGVLGLGSRPLSILDLGCGNAQLYEYFKERGLRCTYTGVDFSIPLLDVARANHANDQSATFMADDVVELGNVQGRFDVALYSHVLEMISSPERSLRQASELARLVVIRFFEPPEFEEDTVELREMEVGESETVPYLRWQLSRDHYRLMLSRTGCRRVDVYRDVTKDQVHVLHYA
jgi:SAM-dependent methyltransferase